MDTLQFLQCSTELSDRVDGGGGGGALKMGLSIKFWVCFWGPYNKIARFRTLLLLYIQLHYA